MARIRTIKPEFWTSEQIVECSIAARLLFIGLWNFCDDAGNHPYSPKSIKMQVMPGDDYTHADISMMIDELIAQNLLVKYHADGKDYLHVTGWAHQYIQRPVYKYPAYNPDTARVHSSVSYKADTSMIQVSDEYGPERKGKERKGIGKEGTGEDARAREIAVDDFEEVEEIVFFEPKQQKIPDGIQVTPGPPEPRPWDEMTVEKCLMQLRSDVQFMESIERLYRIDRSIVPEWMDAYQQWKSARDGPTARLKDVRHHFLNWLRGHDLSKPAKIFKDVTGSTTGKKNGSGAQHTGFELLIDDLDDLIQDSLRDNPI